MNQSLVKKTAIVAAILLFIALFKFFGLGQFLTLEYLKESQNQFTQLYSSNPILVLSCYLLIYVLVTALSLPGAVIMTLAGGGLFGLVTGTIVVSFASSIGATLACFVSRYLLRDWVQKKFGKKLSPINNGIEQEGGFYLFTMRLVPAFPFFLINLAMGVTKIPLFQYYWVSQLGMLPGTVVYVNAGKELAKVESLSGILSPSLILSFALLGIFPLAVKKILTIYTKRKEA